jgi:O-antigen/teichoic acid export membrane protein
MSDPAENASSNENDPAADGETAGFSGSSSASSAHAAPIRLNLPALTRWASHWQTRFLTWMDEILKGAKGSQDPFHLKTAAVVLDRLAGIGSGLAAMIMIDRFYGPGGLGHYAWFYSFLAIAGYLGRYGVPNFVENRITRSVQSVEETAAAAMAALLVLGVVATALCVLAALWGTGTGQRPGDPTAFLLLGPTILFQNINALRLALLNGEGRHHIAAGLKIRQRVTYVVVTLILCMTRMPVTLALAAFPLSQLFMLVSGRKAIKLPAIKTLAIDRRRLRAALNGSRRYLFADNLIDVVFYLDMLILGWFVDSVDLGIYAQALILARLCLVVPTGLRPVVRRLANQWTAAGRLDHLRSTLSRTMRCLFFVHGLLAIFMVVHFPRMMMILFDARQWSHQAVTVLGLVLPGLVFFSAVTAAEPVFEARDQSARLKKITLLVAAANLVLNINLISFAGIDGAAMATAVAMFLHFVLVSRLLAVDPPGVDMLWPAAAASLYLTYVILAGAKMGLLSSILLAAPLLGGLLWMVGFFNASIVDPKPVEATCRHSLEQRLM